jgi:hypothetical protein
VEGKRVSLTVARENSRDKRAGDEKTLVKNTCQKTVE